jgi:hypothetical protein
MVCGLVELLAKSGLVTAAELASGVPAPSSQNAIPPLPADRAGRSCDPIRAGCSPLSTGPAGPDPQHASGWSHTHVGRKRALVPEPWQAQAFAFAVSLSEKAIFTRKEYVTRC